MPNPFPGMDPYLERRWGEAALLLAAYTVDAMNAGLPADLTAHVDREQDRPGATPGPAVDRWVHVRPSADDRPVTVLAFVSPWNQTTNGGRTAYGQRRGRAARSGAHTVDIELVRAGPSVIRRATGDPPAAASADYRVRVTRAGRPPSTVLVPIALRHPLPTVDVPLQSTDADVRLDLQRLVNRAWTGVRDRHARYTADCDPPLTADDAAWADGLLRPAGRRV